MKVGPSDIDAYLRYFLGLGEYADMEREMKFPQLFEFSDQSWVPRGLRQTMREALERAMSPPFRGYYEWVAGKSLACAKRAGITTIVELGAGPAPISQRLAGTPGSDGLRFIVCDLDPDRTAYDALKRAYPDKLAPIYDPVDFRDPPVWPTDALIVVSGALHHLPRADRGAILNKWTRSAGHVLVFEPLRQNVASVAFAALSFVPGLLMPFILFNKPGRLRRILWSWLIPLAPFMFAWDGVVSALRQWTDKEWDIELQRILNPKSSYTIENAGFCQMVSWAGEGKFHDSRAERGEHLSAGVTAVLQ